MESDHTPANRAFLQSYDPLLLKELERLPYQQDPPLPSGEEALDSAKIIVGHDPQPLHLHFGFGLGYLAEVDQCAPNGKILVYEPNPENVKRAMVARDLNFLASKGVILCCNFERFRYLAMKGYVTHLVYRYVVSPYHAKQYPKELGFFQQMVMGLAGEMKIRKRSWLFPTFIQSTVDSMPHYTTSAGCELLAGRLNKPAVIVAAGPSLSKNIAEVAAFQKNAVVFCLGRTSGILEEWGVEPDFLVHVEAQDFSRFIEGRRNLANTTFLLADQVHNYYYRFPHKRTMVFQSRLNPLSRCLSARFPAMNHEVIKTGGSVATAAFYLAYRAGCNPIILVGQDLALTEGRWYSGPGNEQKPMTGSHRVPGYYQGKVVTTGTFYNNIIWYEQSARVLQERDPELKLINATEGGAHIEGFQQMTFKDAASRYLREPVTLPPITSDFPRLEPELLRSFLEDLNGFFKRSQATAQCFSTAELRLLSDLVEGRLPQDPADVLNDYLSAFETMPYLQPLQAVEVKVAHLLRGELQRLGENAPRTRIWATLGALLEQLEVMSGWFPQVKSTE